MKNILNIWGIISLVILIGFSLTACSDGGGGTHTHTSGAAATCTTAQTCTACGEVIQAKLEHNWKWVVTSTSYPANSTETCTLCYIPSGASSRATQVGDTGPAGGIIFYIDSAGFTVTGTESFTAYYLEAAPENAASDIYWSSALKNVTGAVGIGIGTGKANTAAILVVHPQPDDNASNNAAWACVDYRGINNFTDWFLPSKDELNELYKQRGYFDITTGSFWSSSQDGSAMAWVKNFNNGFQAAGGKHFGYANVRAIRAF